MGILTATNVTCGCSVHRRSVLGGTAAVGALAIGRLGSVLGAVPKRLIDVHHHIVAPAWLDALKAAKLDSPPITSWTPEHSIEDMDRAGVATSITSPTAPQVGFLPAAMAATVARASNDYAKQLMTDHPGRFGVFAMLPLPHIDESLKEIEYALDVLKADGIGMLTSYGDKWLGDPMFQPMFDELNRRNATVYTHPAVPSCCVNLVRDVPSVVVEYGADTTRTIASLIFSGASRRYPNINFIFSHGGGVLTAVAERFKIQMVTPPYKGMATREIVDHELNRFYYDTAQIANAVTIGALAKLVPASQIVFGSDFPYRSSEETYRGLMRTFNGATLAGIERRNALRILPRLRSAHG